MTDDDHTRDWMDRLVELHVLAESGDATAAATAERWIADDPRARQVWEDVEQTCHNVRTSG